MGVPVFGGLALYEFGYENAAILAAPFVYLYSSLFHRTREIKRAKSAAFMHDAHCTNLDRIVAENLE